MSPRGITPPGRCRTAARSAQEIRASRGHRGFTLIELVIVMVVIGILAATLGPKFFTQSVFSERGYADELVSALRFAQKAAVSSECSARVTLTATTYVAQQQAASGNACNPLDSTWSITLVGADGAAIQGSAPANTTVSPTGNFVFDSQGRLASSPGTTLTVGSRSISIVSGTGLVQVQ